MSQFIKRILNFNYADANYAWSSPKLNRVSNFKLFIPSNRTGLLKRAALFLFKLLRSCKRPITFNSKKLSCSVLVYYGSLNQKKALEIILKKVDCISCSECLKSDVKLSLMQAYIFSLILSPLFTVFIWRNKNTYANSSLKYNLDGYLLSLGLYIYWYLKLKNGKPKLVVMSNDHNPMNRALLYACEDLSIKTLYLQHAPAVEGFPPLDFTYAFLEGQHAKETYRIKENCNYYFIGSNLIRNNYSVNKSLKKGMIGISTGLISNFLEVEELIKAVNSKLTLILRPHPADPRLDKWKMLAEKYNIRFNNPYIESPKVFFEEISVLVGPMSGLLLEAATQKILPFCFNGQSEVPDWYSLLDNRVCIELNSGVELLKWLEDEPLNKLIEGTYQASTFYYTVYPNKPFDDVVADKLALIGLKVK